MKEELNKEDLIFALYKDKIITCSSFCEMCRKKYKIDKPMDIYVRINNYQIDKYGTQLVYDCIDDHDSAVEKCKRANVRIQTMKRYYRKNNRRSKYGD